LNDDWPVVQRPSCEMSCLEIANQVMHADFERVGNDFERFERHALVSVLQPVNMHTIQAREFGKLFLRDALLAADCPDSLPNESVDVLQEFRLLMYTRSIGTAYKQHLQRVVLI
jgi:hypothetical protein